MIGVILHHTLVGCVTNSFGGENGFFTEKLMATLADVKWRFDCIDLVVNLTVDNEFFTPEVS